MKQQNDPFCSPIRSVPSTQSCFLCWISSSNSAAAIPIVYCTEAVRRTRDVLNNGKASQKAI
jgi:hypothetical protein